VVARLSKESHANAKPLAPTTDAGGVYEPKESQDHRAAVLYVEDHAPLARLMRAQVFAQHEAEDLEVVHAGTLPAALAAIKSTRRYSGFIVDWWLAYASAAPLLATIRALYPGTGIVVFTGRGEDPELCRRLRSSYGAELIEKGARVQDWRRVFADAKACARRMAERRRNFRAAGHRSDPLSPRERFLLEALHDGAQLPDIQAALGRSDRHIARALAKAVRKVGASSVAEFLDRAW
jgi:FixJ family two-component response regulator